MSGERVVVTGASGFIGSHVVDDLIARGATVVAGIQHPGDTRWLPRDVVETRVIDVVTGEGLADALRGADRVYHLAGVTGNATAAEFDAVNFRGTERVARTALAVAPNLACFVYVSSLAAMGPSTAERPHAEDAPRAPICPYGRSKRDAEVALEAMEDLPLAIVRPPVTVGPRDALGLSLFKLVQLGVWPIVGDGQQALSAVSVEDLAPWVVAAGLVPPGEGHCFHVPAEGIDVVGLGLALGRAVGVQPRVVRVPVPLALAAAWAAEGLRALTGLTTSFGVRKVHDLRCPAWTSQTSRSWSARRYGLEVGMARAVRWYRDEGWLAAR